MSEDLAIALAEELGAGDVVDLTRLSGGASRETWSFRADGRPLILQRQRAGDTRDMAVEARVVRAAHTAGVPTPELVASGSGRVGSHFMILSHVDGETIARKILRDERFETARTLLIPQLAAALATLHAIDPTEIPGLPTTDQVQQYRQTLDDLDESLHQTHPAFELAFRWLEKNRPTETRRSLVHGDFRLGNIMVGEDGLRAVLDWELAHVGDPMEDLGWLCVRAWRFGATPPVAGIGEYDTLITAYERASGLRVDRDLVHWWEVLGTLKWGIMCMIQASSHLLGILRSHEMAAIGRRVCENEYDLFVALEGRWTRAR
ncbi:MAG: phosphotransferase family protein [Ilumatobacteraceae bacterium]